MPPLSRSLSTIALALLVAGQARAQAAPKEPSWDFTAYGMAALDIMHDSTQGFREGVNNNTLPRPGTYRAEHDQLQFTARDSRLGLLVTAPEVSGIRVSGRAELDFRGTQNAEITENDFYVFGPVRMRYFYSLAQTPVVDVLAGQYDDLLGWGGAGFYPNTLAFLGIPGQLFHREPQLRISKTLALGELTFDAATAAQRPVHKASGFPDLRAGLMFAYEGWTGARTPGYGQTNVGPVALGLSGALRRFEPAEFLAQPGDSVSEWGWGYALNARVPVIPASDAGDVGNALTLIGELNGGSGIADLYTELSGGALFPTLSNPAGDTPPPLYQADIDSGIVTFDGEGRLRTIDWRGLVVGLQYYLPVWNGRVWVSGNYSRLDSDNVAELTPISARQAVYVRAEYIDANLFVKLTEAFRVGLSFQTVKQTFSDGVWTRNHRSQAAVHFFF
jgi:hypothetical protein